MTQTVQFLFELQQLKLLKNSGYRLANISHPNSIAEHMITATQIGYVLAIMEWGDIAKVTQMLMRHDVGEIRVGDVNKIQARYIQNKKTAEHQAQQEQLTHIPWGAYILELLEEMEAKITLEAIIAKDADLLEKAFQAKIYVEQGYTSAQNWIDNVGNALKTNAAKMIFEEMIHSHSTDWWMKNDLKKIS